MSKNVYLVCRLLEGTNKPDIENEALIKCEEKQMWNFLHGKLMDKGIGIQIY